MGAGALAASRQVEPEASTSSISVLNNMSSCAICSREFTLFKRKKLCYDCGRHLCSSCISKVPWRPSNQRQCRNCSNLYSGNFTRNDLNLLQLRDLRHFLSRNNIPTHMCKEKQDLVDLVLKKYGSEEYRQAQIAHQQYINVLKERRELEDEELSIVSEADDSNTQTVPEPSQSETIESAGTHTESSIRTNARTAQGDRSQETETVTQPSAGQDGRNNVAGNSEGNGSSNGSSRAGVSEGEPQKSGNQAASSNTQDNGQAIGTGSRPDAAQARNGQETEGGHSSNSSPDAEEMRGDELRELNPSIQPEPQLPGSVPEEAEGPDYSQMRRISMSDIPSPDHVTFLSVRQLKEILARHFVDYKGCCERWELEDRVRRLWQESSNNRAKVSETSTAGVGGDDLCRVCMDAVIDCVLLECGHMVACTKCGKRLAECPICRQYVIRAVHVFRS